MAYLELSRNPGLTGCIPLALRNVPSNDLDDLPLPDCPPPPPPPCENGVAVANPDDNSGLVADCVALLTIRDPLRGHAPLNWDPATPIAEWDGVIVGGEPPRVRQLDLRRRGLTGRLPPQLGGLTELRTLILDENRLRGPIPAALASLRLLESLSLLANHLSGPIPAGLGSLRKLSSVGLSTNRLTGPIPASLGSLSQLRWLSLRSNQLTGPIPPELGSCRPSKALSGRKSVERPDPG